MNVSGYWTGVGSRETPDEILLLMTFVAKLLTDLGWVLRSGGAKGADSAFYAGAKQSANFYNAKPYIYLSWNGMKNGVEKLYENPSEGLYDAQQYPTWNAANDRAFELRGSWERCGQGGIAHHTRNVFQVLGHDLFTPSKFLICWAIPVGKQGAVKGGTNTAVKLALQENIDVINLYTEEGFNRVVALLDKHNVEHSFEFRKVS